MSATDRRRFLIQSAAVAGVSVVGRGWAAEPPAKGLVIGQADGAAAGNAVLAGGGNAVDAVVTAALVAGVVALPSTGIGGYGGHAVIARPDGTVSALDFNGTAPAAATPDLFPLDAQGNVKDRVNAHGWLAAGVPGVLAGLQLLLDKFGTRKFADVVTPAVRIARDGFPLPRGIANAINAQKARLVRDPECGTLLLRDGRPLAAGDTFRNTGLADMLQALAEAGRVDAFYDGKIARQIAAAFRANGGLVTEKDLTAFRPVELAPLTVTCRGFTVHTVPLTAGGVSVLQALNTMEALGWAGSESAAAVQARVEALRVAWDDRLRLLGDPKFADDPTRRLLSPEHARQSAERVRAAVAAKKPVEVRTDGRGAGGTIHLNAVDASGLAVALTFTHGEGFGAGVAVPGLGLILGHGMSRFEPRPGHPNSVVGGKRPLTNMCPTVVTRDGKPVLAVGATGGRRIPNTLFDVLAYRLGEGRPLGAAVRGPRVHTEGGRELVCEAAWPKPVTRHLVEVGYAVKAGAGATLSAIERDPVTGAVQSAMR